MTGFKEKTYLEHWRKMICTLAVVNIILNLGKVALHVPIEPYRYCLEVEWALLMSFPGAWWSKWVDRRWR